MVLVDMTKYNRVRKDGSVEPDMKKEKEIEEYLDRVWGKYCKTDTKKSSDTRRRGRPMLRSSEEAVVVPREGPEWEKWIPVSERELWQTSEHAEAAFITQRFHPGG